MRRVLLVLATSLQFLTIPFFGVVRSSKVEIISLPDGEVTTKFRHHNLTILQTSADGYNLMQASNGTVLIIFWSFGGEMLNCDYETDPHVIHGFEQEFDSKVSVSKSNVASSLNLTSQGIDDLTTAVSNISRSGIKKCQEFFNRFQSFSLKRQEMGKRRDKRDLMLFPGTQWCGSGYSGENFMQLGHNAAADRCCRDHDQCRHTIAPFTTKYNYFNYRFHTISHCRCDERFRSCLRLSNTGASNLIGKLFFNVVKTKCFILKKEKVCKRRTWWGTCIKKRKTRQAYIKEPTPFVPRFQIPSRY